MAFVKENTKILLLAKDPAAINSLELILPQAEVEMVSTTDVLDLSGDHHKSPDIIVIDLDEPTVENWQICSSIRRLYNLPILILSPLDSPRIVEEALSAGADDYLVKPVRMLELKAHMDSLLKRSQAKLVQVHAGIE